MLTQMDKENMLREFPNVKLSYENITHKKVTMTGVCKVRSFAVNAPPTQKLPSIDKSSNLIIHDVSQVPSVIRPKIRPKEILLSIMIILHL